MSAQAFVPITVHAAGIERYDAPVEAMVEAELMADLMASLSLPNGFRLIEIDDAGASLDRQMCCQVDLDHDGSGHLTFLLTGKTPT